MTGVRALGRPQGNALAIPLAAPARGETVYVIPGTHNWVCPQGVTSVSVVCVGGGGGGGYGTASGITGGGGGALAYINNYSVTPGASYTVVVGEGGKPRILNTSTTFTAGTNGGTSYFVDTSTCAAGGGQAGFGGITWVSTPPSGGTVLAGTGFSGGRSGGAYSSGTPTNAGGGGGGAGGYSGAGGSPYHFSGSSMTSAIAPSGGAGGYGGFYQQGGGNVGGCGGGGGVGLYGEGATGSVPADGSGTGAGGAAAVVARTVGRDLALQIKRPLGVVAVCLVVEGAAHKLLVLFHTPPVAVMVVMVQYALSGPEALVNSLRLT